MSRDFSPEFIERATDGSIEIVTGDYPYDESNYADVDIDSLDLDDDDEEEEE